MTELEYEIELELEDEEIDLEVDPDLTLVINHSDTDPYTGEYSFTPTTAEQIVEIKDLRATENIIIGPIPQNYGLITWNGATLTVS